MRYLRVFVVGLLLFGGGLLLIGSPDWSFATRGGPDGDSDQDPPSTSAPADPTPCDPGESLMDELGSRGFEPGEYLFDGDVDWAKNPVDNTTGSFGGQLENRRELSQFLRGDAAASRAAREIVLEAVPDDERSRALSGRGFTAVQFLVPVDYTGNLEWDGVQPINNKQVKRAQKGDVVWVYLTRDCDVLWTPSVRADCGNVSYHSLVPVRQEDV